MKTAHISVLLALFILFNLSVLGQQNEKEKLEKGRELVTKYLILVKPDNIITTKGEDLFKDLFASDARITFDVPFITKDFQNTEVKRISKDDRQQNEYISAFGKSVPVDKYVELVQRNLVEANRENISYSMEMTGQKDVSRIKRDTVIFEIKKHFDNNELTLAMTTTYLVSIRFLNGNPIIYNIKENNENTHELDILITMVDLSAERYDEEYLISNVSAKFLLKNEEPINNEQLNGISDSIGQIRFSNAAGKRSIIYLDTIEHPSGRRYSIPFDWKKNGKKVSEQPADGFTIGVRPYSWNGLSYTVSLSAGGFIPDEIDQANLNEGSNFNSAIGYKASLDFIINYFFNHDKLKNDPYKWIFGLGSGVSIGYQQSTVTSDGFVQNKYPYKDNEDENCEIEFKVNSLSESKNLLTVTLPLFIELRKRTGRKFSLALRAGANFSLAPLSKYESSASISRWGYYTSENTDYPPIKDDQVLNYYTDHEQSYSGDIVYNTPLIEGFFRFSGFFHIFKKNPDNSLEIGLQLAMPYSKSSSYEYPPGREYTYNGYWILREGDSYQSLAYASSRIYQYYFGLSVGINFMRYKPR